MTTTKPRFYSMTLHELASWVLANNFIDGVSQFDELPATDDLDDDEEAAAREEYEGLAEELWTLHFNA